MILVLFLVRKYFLVLSKLILVLFLVRKYTQAILTEEDDNLKDGENPLSRKQLTYTNNYKYYLLESNYLEWKNASHAGYKCLIWIHFCLKSADFCILLWLKPDDYAGHGENSMNFQLLFRVQLFEINWVVEKSLIIKTFFL